MESRSTALRITAKVEPIYATLVSRQNQERPITLKRPEGCGPLCLTGLKATVVGNAAATSPMSV